MPSILRSHLSSARAKTCSLSSLLLASCVRPSLETRSRFGLGLIGVWRRFRGVRLIKHRRSNYILVRMSDIFFLNIKRPIMAFSSGVATS
jgi:hypothetical protein